MTQKIVSQLDANGYLVGPVEADESPLEKGVFHIPGGAVDYAPIDVPAGHRAKWNGDGFDFEEVRTTEATVTESSVPEQPA